MNLKYKVRYLDYSLIKLLLHMFSPYALFFGRACFILGMIKAEEFFEDGLLLIIKNCGDNNKLKKTEEGL